MKYHFIVFFLVFKLDKAGSKVSDVEKLDICSRLNCSAEHLSVCGLRAEGNGYRLKLFENECELLKYGCSVDVENAYGIINKEYCERTFAADYIETANNTVNTDENMKNELFEPSATNACAVKCDDGAKKEVCGIREDGVGYRIRLFHNNCDLTQYNCKNTLDFIETEMFICKERDHYKNDEENISRDSVKLTTDIIHSIGGVNGNDNNEFNVNKKIRNVIVVNSKIFGDYNNINDSIDTFFAASHVLDLPIKEVSMNTRRKLLKYTGPIKLFVPWIEKPENISNDTFHRPTLSSCYHKCPFKCPDTYAPVCGVPGVVAREPSIMFQNHCFMDVAQCKMYWENKSSTSHSSSYVESSFLFCMGDEMNAVYRFLPAIRTLQHMGRLKKKGKFRAILKNFRFVSEFKYGRPKFMG